MSLENILKELVIEIKDLNMTISRYVNKTEKSDHVDDCDDRRIGRTLEEVRASLMLKVPPQTDTEDEIGEFEEEIEEVEEEIVTPVKNKKEKKKEVVQTLTVQEIATYEQVSNLAKAKVNQGVDPEEIRTLLRVNYKIAKISEASDEQLGMIFEDLKLMGQKEEF